MIEKNKVSLLRAIALDIMVIGKKDNYIESSLEDNIGIIIENQICSNDLNSYLEIKSKNVEDIANTLTEFDFQKIRKIYWNEIYSSCIKKKIMYGNELFLFDDEKTKVVYSSQEEFDNTDIFYIKYIFSISVENKK